MLNAGDRPSAKVRAGSDFSFVFALLLRFRATLSPNVISSKNYSTLEDRTSILNSGFQILMKVSLENPIGMEILEICS